MQFLFRYWFFSNSYWLIRLNVFKIVIMGAVAFLALTTIYTKLAYFISNYSGNGSI